MGLTAQWVPRVFGRDVAFITKWTTDLEVRNRYDGHRVFLAVAFAL